ANEAKIEQLGVSAETIARYGADSAEAAQAMAEGARTRLRADVAVAVTGIAGPGGGTAEKPVGRVHLHVEAPHGGEALELTIPGDREGIRRRATVTALHLVRRVLAQSRHRHV
ncbi:MAG: nicotinamide-nucleotide amidohydrolase family protein, partial [Actinomycetota bacterium]|nr:nicotinamide-nucleotide amidohydrolase family protein [Actinomycetota bacterium]